jgi:aminopeptidase N
VNSLEDGDGQPLVYVKRGPTGGYVVLPEEKPAGTELLVRLEYETEGSIRKLTPTFSYVERGGWLPFVSFTDRIDDFNLTITAPSKFQTISVGTKVSEIEKGDRVTTEWKAKHVTFPTIIFGDYNQDSSKTTATKFDGTEIPVTIYVDKDSMRSFGIPPKNLRPLAAQAVNALNFYRERFGVDYPFDKLDLVNSPAQGLSAQSPASIVYVGNPVFRSKSLMTGGWNAADTASFLDSVIAHEVGHQWFGAVVGNKNSRSYWFIESLAEYASALYMEFVASEGYQKPEKGRKAYMKMVDGWRKTILETDLMNCIQNSEVAYLGESYGRARQALIYNKGPYAFHILRETFGDEKMFAFLKTLTTELAGKNVVTRDIQHVAEQSFGGTMEWFFDQWIRGIGIPQYAFNFEYRKAEDGTFIVQGNVKQRVVAGLKKYVLDDVYYRGIIPVVVEGRDGQEYRKGLLVEGAQTDFAFKVPVEPMEITFNDDGEILAESVIYNLEF